MTRFVTIFAVSMMMVSVFGFPETKVKRGFNDDFAIDGGDREGDERNASIDNENGTDCSGDTGANEDIGSHEIPYDHDSSLEDSHGRHSFSKSSATSSASASSTSYNLNNQNNIIPK